MVKLTPNRAEAARFLNVLHRNGSFTFQTFDDNQDRKDRSLTRTLHGTLQEHFATLCKLNQQGAGVFVTVNETDNTGRTASNIIKIRAVFVDLDGAPLEGVLTAQVEASIIVESSNDRWHAYYLVDDLALTDFKQMQVALAKRFNGDGAVNDLPRVMRLPGFFHQKVKKGKKHEPFMTRIECAHEPGLTYSGNTLFQYFNPTDTTPGHASDIKCQRFGTHGAELKEALRYIDPSPRDVWVKVGHALKSEDPDLLAEFLSWSRGDLQDKQPVTFVSDADVISNWNSFHPERIGIGVIFKMAQEQGFQPGSSRRNLQLGSQVEVARLIKEDIKTTDGVDLVFDEGAFWRYRSTHWVDETANEIRKRVHKFDGVQFGKNGRIRLTKGFIDGVITELAAMTACPKYFDARPIGVNVSNGFASVDSIVGVRIEPHRPEHRQRFILSQDYRAGLSEIPEGLLQTLLSGSIEENRVDVHRLILEIVGSAITGVNTYLKSPKAFVLFGANAANGKSQIQGLIRALLPTSVTESVAPAELGDPQFLARLAGCQVNLSDEISGTKAIASDRFKAVITGDPVSAKVVYAAPFTFIPRALHVFSANQLPTFSGGVDGGVERRLVVVPFERTIPENERIPDLGKKIAQQEGDIIVSLAIDAAVDVLKRGRYSIPDNCEAATKQWFKDVDPVHEWLHDGGLNKHVTSAGMLRNDVYKAFLDDVRELGINFFPSRHRFTQRLRDFVEADGGWRIVKRAKGVMIFPNDLLVGVTEVTQFR